eukprot:TRINITY_DN10856_c0_g1_i1.p1 TRINITY_DN10856_c0_g1~~TRINITY_DN10856_c0_g1_i1.p1  ORF type:complete len:324 (-),score=50.30 TRINITY_DN10856_c0_g1_i1:23-994(-)
MSDTTTETSLSDEQIAFLTLFSAIMEYVQIVLLGISVLTSLFTIVTFTIFPRIRTYPIKLILFLCVTIVMGYSLFLFNSYFAEIPELCPIVGALIHYFFLSNFFWCGNIAFNFYQMIVRRNPETENFEKFYHFVGWGVPCISVIVVGLTENYGLQEGSSACYIANPIAVFLGFFLPGFLLVSLNSVLFFFVASEIHGTLSKAPSDRENKNKAKELRVLLSIFVTVGLSWIFGFITAISYRALIVYYIFLVLFSLTAPLQGLFIFIAYCLNKKVKNRWMNFFGICFPCCRVDENATGKTGTASTRGGGYSSSVASTRSIASRQY